MTPHDPRDSRDPRGHAPHAPHAPHTCSAYPHVLRSIEGPYWLARILGEAYRAEEDLVLAGQQIPNGYWLVEAQWYNLVQVRALISPALLHSIALISTPSQSDLLLISNCLLCQTSQRAYVLQKEKIKLNVNAMVRLPEPIEFEHVKTRKALAGQAAPTKSSPRLQANTSMQPPPPKSKQPEREKPHFLGEPKHNEILVSLAHVRS